MKKLSIYILSVLFGLTIMFSGCASDNPTPIDTSRDKYVLITLADRVSGTKAGFISTFDEFPSGIISNASSGSLEGQGMGGWRTYENMIFKMFRTSDYSTGIEKIHIAADGTVTSGQFIMSKDPSAAAKYFGTGNLVIQNETNGFYWDAAEPAKIQKFNPTTMQNTGSIDLSAALNERGNAISEITFRSAGQKLLAIKDGKLFANLTYATSPTSQIGFFDDFFPDVYIAVIDVASESYEKTIKIDDTGSIAYINENHMYDFDTNEDLYLVTQGRSALGGKSKIVRIRANETDIDQNWELNFSDFRAEDNGKFVNVFAKNGRLIFTLNTASLTGGGNGNINSADIWEFYSLDVNNNEFRKIAGVPVGTNPGAAMAAVDVDGKVLLRGSTKNGENGYYEYDFGSNSATSAFSVNVGGAVSGFYKVIVD